MPLVCELLHAKDGCRPQRGPTTLGRNKLSMSRRRLLAGLGVLLGTSLFTLTLVAGNSVRNLQPFSDPSGTLTTYSTQKKIDLSNPFFQQLGTNGRSCASCHVISDAWSVSAAHLQQRFQATQGLDPIFRPIDGANCPSADVSTLEAHFRLQPSAEQRSYPHVAACSRRCRIQRCGNQRSLCLRGNHFEPTGALSPPTPCYEPALPACNHVGRPRA